MDATKQTDSIRLSKATKHIILTEICKILYPHQEYYPSHSVIVFDMVDYIRAKQNSVNISPQLIDKLMNDCILEFIKYNPKTNIQDIKLNHILERIITHYLTSDPI